MGRFARPALWALQARAVAATTAVQRRGAARAAAAYDLPPLPEVSATALSKHIYYSSTANWLLPGRVLLGANPTRGSVAAVARSCDAAVSLQEPHETNAGYDHAFTSWTAYPLPDLAPAPSLDAQLAAAAKAKEAAAARKRSAVGATTKADGSSRPMTDDRPPGCIATGVPRTSSMTGVDTAAAAMGAAPAMPTLKPGASEIPGISSKGK